MRRALRAAQPGRGCLRCSAYPPTQGGACPPIVTLP